MSNIKIHHEEVEIEPFEDKGWVVRFPVDIPTKRRRLFAFLVSHELLARYRQIRPDLTEIQALINVAFKVVKADAEAEWKGILYRVIFDNALDRTEDPHKILSRGATQ